MAKVFIGMTAYNGERFIERAIQSLVNQTFTDWTMLVSDDASTDRTKEICENWVKKDPRITYYRHEKNIGMFPNFKFVLDRATNDYFMWASQDDLWEKNFLALCVDKLENNQDLGFSMTTVADIDSYDRILREMPAMSIFSGKPSILQIARYVLQPEIFGRCNMMYSVFRTHVIKTIWGIFPQRHVWGSDYLFVLAGISRFNCFIHHEVSFRKRYGGWSSPNALAEDKPDKVRVVSYKNPKNGMFPLGRFTQYFKGHMEALRGTHYQLLVAILLLARLPRAIFIRIKQKIL